MIRNSPIFITYEFSMVLFLILIFQNSNVRVLIEAGPFAHYLMPIHRLPLSLSSFTKETFLESSIQQAPPVTLSHGSLLFYRMRNNL